MKKKKADPSDYEDVDIDDPDNPEWTAEMIRTARPMREVDPDFVKAIEEMRKRGRPPLETPKVQVTIRLDEEVLNSFKEDGPGWQGRINEELKKTVKRRRKR
jgi:uncharacterized protein (DUF4415 family)